MDDLTVSFNERELLIYGRGSARARITWSMSIDSTQPIKILAQASSSEKDISVTRGTSYPVESFESDTIEQAFHQVKILLFQRGWLDAMDLELPSDIDD